MTFAQMKARFLSILNRDDCTEDQAVACLQDSLARITRTVRLPNMERSVILTVDDEALQFMSIPPDLIEVIDIYVADLVYGCGTHALDLKPYRELLRMPSSGAATAYGRFQAAFYFRGYVPKGTEVTLLYYGEFSDFPTQDSENEISASNPDLVIYGALSFAGDIFDHPSQQRWEARFGEMLNEVQALGVDLDSKGGPTSIQPMYQD